MSWVIIFIYSVLTTLSIGDKLSTLLVTPIALFLGVQQYKQNNPDIPVRHPKILKNECPNANETQHRHCAR
jgi:hypothetical protein